MIKYIVTEGKRKKKEKKLKMIWEVEFWMGILSEYFVKKWMRTNLISKLREGSIPVVIHMNTTENYTIFRSSQNKNNTRLWFNFKFVAFPLGQL